jgi:hypothetical protein
MAALAADLGVGPTKGGPDEMTNSAAALTLVVASVVSFASPQQQPFQASLKGRLPSGKQYELRIRQIEFRRGAETKPDDGSMWGIDGGFPTYVVETLALSLDEKKVDFPRKAVWDLCNITSAEVLEKDHKVVVRVAGGDAAGAFQAEFVIRSYRLAERIVRGGEFPDEAWERTEFHYPEDTN